MRRSHIVLESRRIMKYHDHEQGNRMSRMRMGFDLKFAPRANMALVGLVGLLVGGAVYVLDRPADSTLLFLPSIHIDAGASAFGALGTALPSFAHTFAFILFTAASLRPDLRHAGWIVAAWLGVESAFELGQLEAVAGMTAGPPVLRWFFVGGVFDPLDLVAIALGGAAAALTIVFFSQKEGLHVFAHEVSTATLPGVGDGRHPRRRCPLHGRDRARHRS